MCSPVVWERSRGAEREDGVGDVLRQDLPLEQGPLGVVRAELLLRYPVDGSAFGAPAAGEDPGPADHAVRVDAVDADAVAAEFGGQQPDLVRLVGFGGAVGDVVRPGEHTVLGADVDDVPAYALGLHGAGRLAGDQERPAGHHVVLEVPVRDGGLGQRLGDRQPGVVHHQVHPAEGQRRRGHGRRDLVLVGHVGGERDGHVRAADVGGGRGGVPGVPVGDDHAGALGGEPQRDGPARCRIPRR